MRTLPAAWQAAADAASALRSHEVRVILQLELVPIGLGDPEFLWLTMASEAEDPPGIGAWATEGAFTGTGHYGPFNLLISVPDLTQGHSDLETLTSMATTLSGLVINNALSQDMLDAGLPERFSDLRNLYALANADAWIHANYVGVPWADRLTVKLRLNSLESWTTEVASLSMTDIIGEGVADLNRKITYAEYPGLPLQYGNSPCPIVIGGGSGPARHVRGIVLFNDRVGQEADGSGYVAELYPNKGAPWAIGDRVTFGNATATVASVAGTTDTDTVLTLTAPGLSGGDLPIDEQGYHVTAFPTESRVRFVYADRDFDPPTPVAADVKFLPAGGADLFPLPSYCGTPVFDVVGEFTLDKLPRGPDRQIGTLWVDGDASTSMEAADAFRALCEDKLGLSVGEYSIDADVETAAQPLKGSRTEAMNTLAFLRQLELSTCGRIFWDGEMLKFRRRKRVAEILSADMTIDRRDLPSELPEFVAMPEGHRRMGFIARWDRHPALPPGDADSYRQNHEVGTDATGREDEFWWDFLSDEATGEEVAEAWYSILGKLSNGNWPRFIVGLRLDWSYMKLEPEDIVKLVVTAGDGEDFDGLGEANTIFWKVASKGIVWPQGNTPGLVTVSLLETKPEAV